MAWIRSNKKGSGGGGGIPSKYLYSFTKVKEWVESGITSSGWLDDTGTTSLVNDRYVPVEGEYIELVGNSWAAMAVDSSYYAFGIKCQVNSDFSPRQSDTWWQCSCILGQELGGVQRDFAIIIDKNGYFALGYSQSSVMSTTVSALDGNIHELFIIALPDSIVLIVDGELEAEVSITMGGSSMNELGIFNNHDEGYTRVLGKVYRVGYWSYTEPTSNIIIESIPTM